MKTVKRIVAVCLLIVTVLVVGYLVYTGSRLTDGQAIIAQVGGVLCTDEMQSISYFRQSCR